MRPDYGGRIELKLAQGTATTAAYAITVSSPEGELRGAVRIDQPSATLSIASWESGAPPAWLEAYTHALLRSVMRIKGSNGAWPRRLTRWRPAP